MPKATASIERSERFELETLPDGWVELRRMTYGQKLRRQQMAGNLRISNEKNTDYAGEMDLVNAKVTEYEFKNCIADHNLEDDNGRQLDFRKRMDIDSLDPRVGEEISELIGRMNNYEEESDEGNSRAGSGPA